MKKNQNKEILKIMREKKLHNEESSELGFFTESSLRIVEKSKFKEFLKAMSEEEILELLFTVGSYHDYCSYWKHITETIGGFAVSDLGIEESIEYYDYIVKCNKRFFEIMKEEYLIEMTEGDEHRILMKFTREGRIELQQ